MEKKDKEDLIFKWLQDNNLFYAVNPKDNGAVLRYRDNLERVMPKLYKFCIEKDMIEEGDLRGFAHMIMVELDHSRMDAIFSM